MSQSKSKCWYLNNCSHFFKHAVPESAYILEYIIWYLVKCIIQQTFEFKILKSTHKKQKWLTNFSKKIHYLKIPKVSNFCIHPNKYYLVLSVMHKLTYLEFL